jgi:hypothetical protein
MSAEAIVRDYYEALRRGEPLSPYFAERPDVVKFGVGERLDGYDAIAEGLREQARITDDWTVESHALAVTERDGWGWFSDEVRLAWTQRGTDYDFETRWSGTLDRRDDEWLFVGLHVSAPVETGGGD